MSLFSVLKYPISDPVRPGEITHLPEKILIDEINRTAGRDTLAHIGLSRIVKDIENRIIWVGKWVGYYGQITPDSLRKAIKEYDEPV